MYLELTSCHRHTSAISRAAGEFEFMCYPGPSNTGRLLETCTGHYPGVLPAYTDMVDGTNLTWANAYVYHGSSLIDVLVVKQ
jgi:hypothetical protein